MSQPAKLLAAAGLEATANRTLVLGSVRKAKSALTPPELLEMLHGAMNKVTLYRILDLLVEHGLIERHSGAGRAYHYCTGRGHGHFHCTRCGKMLCLNQPEAAINMDRLSHHPLGRVDAVEIRLDGVCEQCLKD